MMNMLHAESEEIIRALRQYNDFVKEFYDKTKAQNEENAKRMESLEKSKKRLTITSIIVSVVGVIASVIVGIFF